MTEPASPASIAGAAALLRSGALTATALAENTLERIAALNPRLNAFITVTAERALATARERDAELRAGHDRGPLHGISIAHKDCFDTASIATTAGAPSLRDRVPERDAAVVRRLHEAGAVMLGKTHMNEFAAGMSGKNPFFGDCRNPWNVSRAPGGSSSGSAVAVAAGMCLAASGSDGGGSIRLPASWVGIVGLRPTFGRVSKAGAVPRSWSFDCAGPLTRCVRDTALLLNAIAGHDAADPASLPDPAEDCVAGLECGVKGLRIGVVEEFAFRDVDDDAAEALQDAFDVFRSLGAEIRKIAVPALSSGPPYAAVFDILLFEFAQILGEKYRACADREARFGPVVRANLERGAGIRAAQYEAALAERTKYTAQVRRAFSEVDALASPTAPMTALPLAAPDAAFDRARRFTIPFSFAGLPAISVPCGFDRDGLPIGLQLVGDRLQEAKLLQIAAAYEAATPFHARMPPR